jgi:glycine dehydrogenase subunit 1
VTADGSPYAPHTDEEVTAMLDAVDADSVDALFDVPDEHRFDGDVGIPAADEREARDDVAALLARNDDLVSFLGRGHHDHYVPSVVDHLADRSEFLTSYTQYQPEVAQGFLQALFEYQSMLVELTGLGVANASMYDRATALGEAALLSARVGSGDAVYVPDTTPERRRSVLANYLAGIDADVAVYPTERGQMTSDGLQAAVAGKRGEGAVGEDPLMIAAATPSIRGAVQEALAGIGDVATDRDALFCVDSDPVALSVLAPPAEQGADVVVGDAAALGLPASYGMGLGLFAARDDHLRQLPGRLVGASEDDAGRRAYTLTLQTREQHIRRERATSNICTNQAWVALRAAIHAATLGPDGLVDLAEDCVAHARDLATRVDAVDGLSAPVDDGAPFREFVARLDDGVEGDADDVRDALLERGYAVHALGGGARGRAGGGDGGAGDELQLCVTETNADAVDGLVDALGDAVAEVR